MNFKNPRGLLPVFYRKIIFKIDALAFGFPCNDFSIVGKQKGIDAENCKDALKRRPNEISKKTEQLLEDCNYDAEYILSSEFMEQFQV